MFFFLKRQAAENLEKNFVLYALSDEDEAFMAASGFTSINARKKKIQGETIVIGIMQGALAGFFAFWGSGHSMAGCGFFGGKIMAILRFVPGIGASLILGGRAVIYLTVDRPGF